MEGKMAKVKRLAVAILICCITSSAAQADADAVLQQIRGTVMVNLGEMYGTATEGMPVAIGDQLMVMEQGSAILSYADGCSVPLSQDAVITVRPVSVSCDNRQATVAIVTTEYTATAIEYGLIRGLVAVAIVGGYVVLHNNRTPSN